MQIDESTGLPELPEGYFWRVEDTYKISGLGTWPAIHVMLLKNTTELRWFKRVPATLVIDNKFRHRDDVAQNGGIKRAISDLAKHIYGNNKDRMGILNPLEAEMKKYVGDYPPKNINQI